jgi:AraC-like DNA-binding protein
LDVGDSSKKRRNNNSMNSIITAVIAACGIYAYLAIYYLVHLVRFGYNRILFSFINICIINALYTVTRAGLYGSQNTTDAYSWFLASHAVIPLLAAAVVFWVYTFFQKKRTGMFIFGMVMFPSLAGLILIKPDWFFTREVNIAHSMEFFGSHITRVMFKNGSLIHLLYFLLLVSICYFYVHIFFLGTLKDERHKKPLVIGMTLFFVLIIIDLLNNYLRFNVIFFTEFGLLVITMIIPFTNIHRYGDDHFSSATSHELADGKTQRYQKSLLKNFDTAQIKAKLQELMDTEHVYRDPDINLKQLADMVSLTPHQLSQFLNAEMGMEFRNFINKYRVEEGIKLLEKDSEASILNICFTIGFNSKTAFNDAFRKHTGLSPSQFKKQHCK